MKIYFPDDPVKQELLEAHGEAIKACCSDCMDCSFDYANCDYKECSAIKPSKEAIEKATSEKIEEVLK